MTKYFEISGTRIDILTITDFRTIQVEFIYRPVFQESKKSLMSAIVGKRYEFAYMEPYAAIIGQQGQKSELGEYKTKTFKEALGKDISGAVIYTIADKLKIKALKHKKYQCVNLAGRAFTSYLDDIPAKMIWADGRIAEVFKEDELYTQLNKITTPGIEYITALVIKANEVFCFYGNGIQIIDAACEFDRLIREQEAYLQEKAQKKTMLLEKKTQTLFSAFHLPSKKNESKENVEQHSYSEDE